MTDNEQLTLAISSASLLVSIFALIRSSSHAAKANALSGENLKLSHASVEIGLQKTIEDAKKRVADFFIKHGALLSKKESELSSDEKAERQRVVQASEQAIEGYLTVLDAACRKYREGKIDKAWFQKEFKREVRQAVQDEAHEDYFKTGHAFNALIKVYEEWENPEK